MGYQTLSGVRLIEQGDNVLVANVRRKHGFEPHTIALWRILSKRGKTMVDIGSYTGFYALLASISGASKVYAYEPNPIAVARMSENIDLNNVDNIDLRSIALWDTEGVMALRGKPTLTSAGSLVSDASVITTVRTGRLDDEGLDRVYGIKIDVERAEPQVLMGALDTLKEYTPHILIEALGTTSDIDDILCPIGYSGRKLDGGMYYYRVMNNG